MTLMEKREQAHQAFCEHIGRNRDHAAYLSDPRTQAFLEALVVKPVSLGYRALEES